MSGALYVVATPIGNLEDLSFRALKVLQEVDLIACEDTRHTKILLERYRVKKPLISYHQHTRVERLGEIISVLLQGKNVALVSDAGTPGISDPGSLLVAKAVEQNISVIPIPGPSALISLASVSGVPMDRFLFLGFLPHKKGRQTLLKEILESERPVIFYESPHRILKTLSALSDSKGYLIVGRELTKKFEEIVRGAPKKIYEYLKDKKILGEFVIIYAPKT